MVHVNVALPPSCCLFTAMSDLRGYELILMNEYLIFSGLYYVAMLVVFADSIWLEFFGAAMLFTILDP